MAGTIDGLEQDAISNKSAFMEIQQQLSMPHHQAYSSIRSSYAPGAQSAHEAFAQAQGPRSLSGYPFASMNNSPLHNTYSHHTGHPYIGSYPPNVSNCAPCPSPTRDGEFYNLLFILMVFYPSLCSLNHLLICCYLRQKTV
jgi:distal-less (fragment)